MIFFFRTRFFLIQNFKNKFLSVCFSPWTKTRLKTGLQKLDYNWTKTGGNCIKTGQKEKILLKLH